MISYQNEFGAALPLAIWLATDEYMYAKSATEISTTTLMKSPRYIIASKREMYPELWEEHLRPILDVNAIPPDIQDKTASRIGVAIHDSIEKAIINNYENALKLLGYPDNIIKRVLVNPKDKDIKKDSIVIYTEQRMYRDYDYQLVPYTISGQFDLVIDGELHDYKSTKTYVYEKGLNREKYILQGSIYRWLNPELITGDHITINFVFKDFRNNSNYIENYPSAQCISERYPLMSLKETEAYIHNKIKTLEKYWKEPLNHIPCCTEQELFSAGSTFKYFKTGYEEGKRATKNFKTLAEASKYKAIKGNHQGEIIEFKGKPFTCPYCNLEEVANSMVQVAETPKEFEIE